MEEPGDGHDWGKLNPLEREAIILGFAGKAKAQKVENGDSDGSSDDGPQIRAETLFEEALV